MDCRKQDAFAIWLTGLPASGKSTIAHVVRMELAGRGIDAAVLESDALREELRELSAYDSAGRDRFYRYMGYAGVLLTEHGIPVIFDATANRRAYRNSARQKIPRFLEIYIDCPLATCMTRDRKGTYRKALEGDADSVPGLQESYEPPECADLTISTDHESPEESARRILTMLIEKGFIAPSVAHQDAAPTDDRVP